MSDEQKKLLEQQLWAIANLLRGKMDADDYRNYILGFIFFKYLSEKLHIYADGILEEDNLKYETLNENKDKDKLYIEGVKKACIKKLGYFLKPSELFSNIAKKGNNLVDSATNDNDEATQFFILDDLERILNNIEQSTMGTDSEDDFVRLFEDLDLTSSKLGKTTKEKNTIIAKILNELNKIDFQLEDANADVLGDAYEYLIGEFAAGAGKKAGEFYTPQQVSTILAKIVTTRKKRLKSVYDPTCGSGSLLLRVAKEVEDVGYFYGQELNRTTYNLARMNMTLHDVHYTKFDIKQGDTLEEDLHEDLRAEAIVANPPFSAKWSAKSIFASDDRFSQYGRLAPQTKADFAFVQHMIHHLDDNGIMAIVMPHGVLFRGAAEGHIRKYLIQDRNYLDAVIGLPQNIFYGTGIPTCILVFKKCREDDDDILFIDASNEFEKKGNQNKILNKHIDKIIDTYTNRLNLNKFSYRADKKEVELNDCNLKISKYVNTYEESIKINVVDICDELKKVTQFEIINDKIIKEYCDELNLPFPYGNNLFLLGMYKKGLMQNLFNRNNRFKNDNKNFPDWKALKLSDVGNIVTGKTPSTSVSKLWNGDIQFITPTDIKDENKYQISVDRYVTLTPKMKVLPQKTIIYTCIASIGKMCLTKFPCITNQQINSLIPFKDFDNEFLFYAIQYITPKIKSTQANTTLPIINKTEFSLFEIEVPHKDEQVKIAGFLSAIDYKISTITNKLDKFDVFEKDSISNMFI
jgi:type I restriction enzyme M protein